MFKHKEPTMSVKRPAERAKAETGKERKQDNDMLYDIKREATKHIRYLESTVNRISALPRNMDKVKNELWRSLCKTCRSKSYVILDVHTDRFTSVECQTENNDIQLSPKNQHLITSITEVLKEHEALLNGDKHVYDASNVCPDTTTEVTETVKTTGPETNESDTNNRAKIISLEKEVEELRKSLETVTLERDNLRSNRYIKEPNVTDKMAPVEDAVMSHPLENEETTFLKEETERLRACVSNQEKDYLHLQWNIKEATKLNDRLEQEKTALSERLERCTCSKEEQHNGQADVVTEGYVYVTNRTIQADYETPQKENDERLSERDALMKEKESTQTLHQEQIRKLEQEITKFSSDFEKKEQEIENLKGDIGTLEDNCRSHEKEKDGLLSERDDLLEQKESTQQIHQDQIRKLEQAITTFPSNIEEKQQEIAKLKGDLDAADKTLRSVQKENDEGLSERDALMKEKESTQTLHQEQIRKLEQEITKFSSDFEKKEQEIEKLKGDIGTLEDNCRSHEKEKDGLLSERDDLLEQKESTQQIHQDQIRKLEQAITTFPSNIEEKQQEIAKLKGDLDAADKTLRSVQKENDEGLSERDALMKEKESTQKYQQGRIGELEQDIRDVSLNLEEKQRDHQALRGTLEDNRRSYETEKDELVSERDALLEQKESAQQFHQDQIRKLEQTITKFSSNIEEKQQEIEKMKCDVDRQEENLRSAQKERDDRLSIRDMLLQEKQATERNHSEEVRRLQEEMMAISSQQHQKDLDIEELKRDIVKKDDKLRSVEQEREELKSNFGKLQQDSKATQENHSEQMRILTQDKCSILSKLQVLESKIGQLQGELGIKDETIVKLKMDCERAKKKYVVMGLHSARSGMGKSMVDMVHQELIKRLQGKLERENVILTIKPCAKPEEFRDGPLLVLCLNMSRVGTNIQDALGGIKANRDVTVLVLHHTGKENLVSLTPTSLRVTGMELRQLGGILDMAFSSDDGIYDCDLNNSSVEKMLAMLKKC